MKEVGVVTAGTFLEHVCQVVGCHGRHSCNPGPDWWSEISNPGPKLYLMALNIV